MSKLTRLEGGGGKHITMHHVTGRGTQVGEVYGGVQVIERLIVLQPCACGCAGRRSAANHDHALACMFAMILAPCWVLAILFLVGTQTSLIAGPVLAILAVLTFGALQFAVRSDRLVEE